MLRNRLLDKSSGNMVFFGHRDWELVMKLMQGIQLSVNRANQEVERDVTAHDFNVKEKYVVFERGGVRAPSARISIIFTS